MLTNCERHDFVGDEPCPTCLDEKIAEMLSKNKPKETPVEDIQPTNAVTPASEIQGEKVKKERKPYNISDEVRKARAERMRAYWAKRKGN